MFSARTQQISLEQVLCKIRDAEIRRTAALNRARRGKADFDMQVRLACKAQEDYEVWKKVYDSMCNIDTDIGF